METVPDVCPTGILVDIDLQSKSLSKSNKENEKIQASIKNAKEKIIASDTKSSHPWVSNCFLDQSPPRPSPLLKMKFFTPKSNLKTPSPKSMKIISREASRIVNQLYSSPINCSEALIHDEVFPSVKSFDDAYLDEFHIKFKGLSARDTHEKVVHQSDTHQIALKECSISAPSSYTSKDMISDETYSEIVQQSDIKSVEQDSKSGNTVVNVKPENASNQISYAESFVNDKEKVNGVICSVNCDPVIPECLNVSSDKVFEHEHEVISNKKMPTVAKVLGFEMSVKHSERSNSAPCSYSSKDMVSDETYSEIVQQSNIKSAEQDSVSGNTVINVRPENALNQIPYAESCVRDKDKVNSIICAVNCNPVIPECFNVSSDKVFEHEREVTTNKKMPTVAKVLDFKMSVEHSEKNKENISLCNGARQVKYVRQFSKADKSCNSIDAKIKNPISRNESIVEKSSQKNVASKCFVLEKKAKENQNLEESVSKHPKVFRQKSDVPSRSCLYKKDPLCKTGPLLETPVVTSSVRRIQSFHAGTSRNALTVERKFTTDSCSKILKPKMSFNQASINGNGLTPLQSERSKPVVSSAANPIRRKSLAFNSNCSMLASDIKTATDNGRHSTIKKPVVTSSSRHGLVKKLNMPSSLPKFKNDSLSRKLFP